MEPLVTTYLEMRRRESGPEKQQAVQNFEVDEFTEPEWTFNRDMYVAVGGTWRWVDKLPWSNEQWREYANDQNLRTFAAYYENALAGYYELRRSNSPSMPPRGSANEAEVEIAYFGLLPDFIGRRLGAALLTSAIENAWAWWPTPSRVWVHTCNRDHPSALSNYQARGFKIYKVEQGEPSSEV